MTRRSAALLIVLMPASALAHGGGLDANGCHTNRKTGDYHCHRAPAPPPSSGSVSTTPRASSSTRSTVSPLYSAATTSGVGAQGFATERQLVLTAQLLLMALGLHAGQTGWYPDSCHHRGGQAVPE
jgi:hypothetical protein